MQGDSALAHSGTERVISWLTEELVALRHDVTLFASGDSVTSARLEPMWPRALRLDGSVRVPNALHTMIVEQVCRRAKDFDLLHFHLDYYPFSVMSRQAVPFATTLHGRLIFRNINRYSQCSRQFPWCRFPMRSGVRYQTQNGSVRFITDCRRTCSRRSRQYPLTLRF
jgi:Glycosyltransferase Family 4